MNLKIIIVGLLVLHTFPLPAQSEYPATGAIGFSVTAIGSNDVLNTAGATLNGGPSYRGKGFYSFGVTYIKSLGSRFDLETGFGYSKQTILIIPNLPPNIDALPKTEKLSLLNIPVTGRVNLLNYLFINGGLILGMDAGISDHFDSQTGIGALVGIGGNYSFDNGLGAFINLYQQYHSLVSFGGGGNKYRWRLAEGGLRVGVVYNLPGR